MHARAEDQHTLFIPARTSPIESVGFHEQLQTGVSEIPGQVRIVQVRFMRLAMRALRCGLTSLALHGALAQTKRVHVYDEFARCAQGVVLFATDVCARGLDFADVDWVVQVCTRSSRTHTLCFVQYDCAADIDEYIHRVGRTARMHSAGNAVLLVTQSQADAMLPLCAERHVPIVQVELVAHFDPFTEVV